MLECIRSLVTVHKYPLISMKRHLMEGQSDKHAQAFTQSLRKRKGENVIQMCLLNTKHHTSSLCFFCSLPIFHQIEMCISKGKTVRQVLGAHKALWLFLPLGYSLCHCCVILETISNFPHIDMDSKPSLVFAKAKGRLFCSRTLEKNSVQVIFNGWFLVAAFVFCLFVWLVYFNQCLPRNNLVSVNNSVLKKK